MFKRILKENIFQFYLHSSVENWPHWSQKLSLQQALNPLVIMMNWRVAVVKCIGILCIAIVILCTKCHILRPEIICWHIRKIFSNGYSTVWLKFKWHLFLGVQCRVSICQTGFKGFKNTYELLNLRALTFSPVNKILIFQCMGRIFCVEFQRHHTLKDMIFIQHWNFKSS